MTCLNCNTPLSAATAYCHQCGQSVKDTKMSISVILKDTFTNLFNIDGRFLYTLRNLYEPGRLTKAYIGGKRKRFMNPARLFIFCSLIFLTASMSDIDFQDIHFSNEHFEEDVILSKLKVKWDGVTAQYDKQEHGQLLQSLTDSMFAGVVAPEEDYIYDGPSFNDFSLSDYQITKEDMLTLSGDELLDKYQVEGFLPRLVVTQSQKMILNPSGGIQYIIKNLLWVVLILIFVMALFMKILYIRSGKYLVEHLVLLLYFHCLLFLLLSLLIFSIFIMKSSSFTPIAITTVIVSIGVIQYKSLRKYYEQGWFKTLVKQLVINTSYLFLATMIFTLGIVASLAIF